MNGPGLLEALVDLASAREPAVTPRLPSVFESLEADLGVRDERRVEVHDFVPADEAPIPAARHRPPELRKSLAPNVPVHETYDDAETIAQAPLQPSVARRAAARTEPDAPPVPGGRPVRVAAPSRPVDEPLDEPHTHRLSADDELIAHHRIAMGPPVRDEQPQPERHAREWVPAERDQPASIFLPAPGPPLQFSRRDAGEAAAAPVAPVINVTIGRVEVRAVARDVKGAPRGGNGQESKRMSLDEYLERRAGQR